MKEYLNRANSKNDKRLETYSNLLDNAVEFGSNIIGWSSNLGMEFTEVLPVLSMLHKNVETTDATSVLVKRGIQEPIISLNRIILENCFYLKYILRENSTLRAKAYVYCYFRDQIRIHKRFLKDTAQNKDFKSKLEKGNKYDLPDYSNEYSDEQIENLIKIYSSYLKQEIFEKVRNEEKNLKSNYPNWYSFFGGPNNIEELSQKIDLSSWYQIFYRHFSGNIHHDNLLYDTLRFDTGKPELQLPHLRTYDQQLSVHVQLLISINLEVFETYLEHFLPDKLSEYGNWYLQIREPYLNIKNI